MEDVESLNDHGEIAYQVQIHSAHPGQGEDVLNGVSSRVLDHNYRVVDDIGTRMLEGRSPEAGVELGLDHGVPAMVLLERLLA